MRRHLFLTPIARRLLRAGLALTAAFTAAHAQAPLDVRVALVIGNASYAGPAALANPANDAAAMAAALARLGFQVVEVRDAGKAQMASAVQRAAEALRGRRGVGMLYFAGHGLQLDWRNYMVPVDARLGRRDDVAAQTLDLSTVIEAFAAAGTRMNIMVLDACRDNPFAGAASGKGLAQLDAPPGTFLAYATAPGNVAQDGDGGNGLYTQYLLQELGRPQAKIEDVFKRVRLQVRQKSQGRQVPWESTSLEEDFFFDAGLRPQPAPDERARQESFAREKAEWDRIKDSRQPEDFYEFLKKYPTGHVSELATARLERLDVAKVQPQPDRNGLQQSAATIWNRLGDHYSFVWKDGYTGAHLQAGEAAVDRIAGDVVEGRIGSSRFRTTQAGEVSESSYGSFDPPLMQLPAGPLQIGHRWSGRSDFRLPGASEVRWVDWRGKVLAAEKVTVPAGTFDTFKVELQLSFQDGLRVRQTAWYVPGIAFAVRLEHEQRRHGAPERRTREAVAVKLGG